MLSMRRKIAIAALSIAALYLLVTLCRLNETHNRDARYILVPSKEEEGMQGLRITPPPVEASSKSHGRFVLAAHFWEKTTMAVTNMFSLLKIAHDLDAVVPVPFLLKSSLGAFPNRGGVKNFSSHFNYYSSPSLHALFKLDKYESSPPSGLAKLVSYEYFLRELKSQKLQLFYIRIYHGRRKKLHRQSKQIRCSHSSKYFYNNHFPWMRTTCCFVPSHVPILPQEIAKSCGFNDLKSFVVVFQEWRGISAKNRFRLLVPPSYVANYTPPQPSSLEQSNLVVKCANQFMTEVVGKKVEFIGVHLRTEKLGINHKKHGLNDTKCLVKTFRKVKQVQSETGIKKILYFADYYWTFYKKILDSFNAKVTSFDPKEFNCMQSSAFVAQVEQNIMSQASRLIVCGGGSFQKVAMDRFTHRIRVNGSHHKPFIIDGCDLKR
uniref:Peptide-O-fucosyltransferase n=1 Tax=Amphimedon queenslandica TaxID=400682 RepID=A0A1X7V2L2_AMPQE